MQKIRTKIIFLVLFPILAWNNEPPAQWMREKIENDLSSFTKGDVSACLQNLKNVQGIEACGLVRIRYSHATATCEPLFPLFLDQSRAMQGFLSALLLLDSLPDFDLILALNPSFDRPLLLMKTTVPIFAFSKEKHNSKIILIPRFQNLEREMLFQRLPTDWDAKKDIAMWRGFATDGDYRYYDWDFKPRARLALQSRLHRDLLDAAIVPSPNLDPYISRWLDGLTILSPFIPPESIAQCKYLLALDGRAAPTSLEWQLFSRSLIFKADSTQVEWFYDLLIPGTHYLPFDPIRIDELLEKISWAKSHDFESKQIADNGYLFATEHLRTKDLLDYLFHLLSAYSKM